MCTTFVCFLAALLAFESGWDRARYDAGIVQNWQLNQWAGGPVQSRYTNYTSWSQLTDKEWEDMSYRSTDSLGFVGYHFGEALLIDLGYYKADVYFGGGAIKNNWNGQWTGKHGVHSLEDFKTKAAQSYAIKEAFGYSLKILQNQLAAYGKSLNDYLGKSRSYVKDGKTETVTFTLSGIVAASQFRGPWATASVLLRDEVRTDENATSILELIKRFGGYEVPSIKTILAFQEGPVVGDEGLGKLLLPGEKPDKGHGKGGGKKPNDGGNPNPIETASCGSKWYKANLTNYESYPAPGSEECTQYNGCEWAGQFYGIDGKKSREWVAQNNIVAVHMKDWHWLGMKTLRLRQQGRTILARAIDACSDSDCDGCCTKNLGGDGYLIDIEKSTMKRFGSGSGIVEFQPCSK